MSGLSQSLADALGFDGPPAPAPVSLNKERQWARAEDAAEKSAAADRRRELSRAGADARKPGETLAEAAAREAEVAVERRAQARRLTTRHPLGLEPDAEDPDIGTLSAERRARAFADVATPSDLIRRAKRDWPEKCAAVAAFAIAGGMSVAEAWSQIIDLGVEAAREAL